MAYIKQNPLAILPQNIEMIFFDFDGVFTTNEVIVNENGEESVICNRSDGLGVSMLHKLKIPMMIISTEKNPVVTHRANKMKIPVTQGAPNKESILKKIIKDKGINWENVIYVGNDVNDAACMNLVGVSVAPGNAHPHIWDIAKIVLLHDGGKGAVRELVDYIIEVRRDTNR